VLGSVLDAPRGGAGPWRRRKVLIDGCQAVARLALDVKALDVDFYAFSGHKLYGPTGIGALYAKAADARCHAAVAGRRRDDRPRLVRRHDLCPRAAAVRGGHPAIVEAIGLGVAVDYVQAIGLAAIHAHEPRWCAPRARRCAGSTPCACSGRMMPRDRQFRDRRGASARPWHHIGRGRRGHPRRAPLRPAADGIWACPPPPVPALASTAMKAMLPPWCAASSEP
jgi:hypothetical protein